MPWNQQSRHYLLGNGENFHEHYCGIYTLSDIGISERTPHHERIDRTEQARRILLRLTELVPNADHASPGWSGRKPVAILGVVASVGGDLGKLEPDEHRNKRRSIIGLCYEGNEFWLLVSRWWLSQSGIELNGDWEIFNNDPKDRVRRYTGEGIPVGQGVNLANVGPLAADGDLINQLIVPFNAVCAHQAINNAGRGRFFDRLDERNHLDGLPAVAQQVVYPRIVDLAR